MRPLLMPRISRSLKAHLEESGWDDDVRDMAKETARSMETPNLQALLTEITPRAKSGCIVGVCGLIVQVCWVRVCGRRSFRRSRLRWIERWRRLELDYVKAD